MLKRNNSAKNKVIGIFLATITVGTIISFVALWSFQNSTKNTPTITTEQAKGTAKDTPIANADPFKSASDETLGSGFAVKYPDDWTNVHTGAIQPQSTTEGQVDKNTITSPSGKIQVALTVSTLSQAGSLCRDGYITLKYLNADKDPLPSYGKGRFVAYVVYFPDYNLYQYHVGLQKNTDAVRMVTLENNSACNFMFSEFIERNSSLPNVPKTTTLLGITFVDLVSKGQDLKAGINEVQVVERLSGVEYEQAKSIVRSLYIKSD